MNYVLVVKNGNDDQIIELNQPTIMIGTLPSNQIVLDGDGIEPIHGLVESLDDGNWRVTDLGSKIGIKVNQKVIDVEKILVPGDFISIGAVELTFRVEKTVPPPPNLGETVVEESTVISEATRFEGNDSVQKTRADKLFSPREAKPAGDVLEVVAYWGNSVLEVEHFEFNKGVRSKARIGRPPEDDFLSAGPKDLKNYALAKATESGYKIKLIEGMQARLRKSGKVEKVHEGTHGLSRRDIAHVKYGPISYFMLYVRPPVLNLPKSSPRDPLLSALMSIGLLLFFMLSGVLYTGNPKEKVDEKTDSPWEIVTVTREVKKVKREVKKPKVQVSKLKEPPKKPKPPKIPPKKPRPKKPQKVKKKPKQVYVQKNKKNTKKNVITGTNDNRKPKKKPVKSSGGMAKTSKKPDFKHAGKKIAGVKKVHQVESGVVEIEMSARKEKARIGLVLWASKVLRIKKPLV